MGEEVADMTHTAHLTDTATPVPTLLVLLAGPTLSVAAIQAGAANGTWPTEWAFTLAVTVLVVAWSPLFCSVPALLLQDHRDRILPDATRIERAVRILPALLAPDSPARTPQLTALAGLALGVAALTAGLW
jgi:hypothetical protein